MGGGRSLPAKWFRVVDFKLDYTENSTKDIVSLAYLSQNIFVVV